MHWKVAFLGIIAKSLLRHKAKPPAVLFDILTALELEQQNVDESLLKRSSE